MLSGSSYRLGSAFCGSSYRSGCRPQRSGGSYRSDPLGWDYCFSFRSHILRSHLGTSIADGGRSRCSTSSGARSAAPPRWRRPRPLWGAPWHAWGRRTEGKCYVSSTREVSLALYFHMGSLGTPCGKYDIRDEFPLGTHIAPTPRRRPTRRRRRRRRRRRLKRRRRRRLKWRIDWGGNASSSHPFQLQAFQGM